MIEVTEAALTAMENEGGDGPIVMLNLLRFRPDGGRESYQEYARYLNDSGISARYQIKVVYAGTGGRAVVAEDGQEWDMVLLVRYPSTQTFVDMIRDPEYKAGSHYRNDALIESVLQPTVPNT
jgi:uncharacterized protein (DUF1330 family)